MQLPLVEVEEYEQMRIEEPTSQKEELTLQKNNDTIQLDKHQQRAQDKVKKLQSQGELKFHKRTSRHQDHAEKLTGKSGDIAWAEYEKMASDFLKRDIDGIKMDGFMSAGNSLFKFEPETGLFGLLSEYDTISTLFIPDDPLSYWKQQIEQYKPKEQ